MISKEEFIKVLDFIKENRKKEEKLRLALESFDKGATCDVFLFNTYEDIIISLLEDSFNDKYKNVDFFVNLMDFGRNKNIICFEGDDVDTPLYTNSSELYEYLIKSIS